MTDVSLTDLPMMKPDWRRTQTRAADRAWAQHRNEPVDRVPEACKRQVRLLKRSLEPAAKTIDAALRRTEYRGPGADFYFKKNEAGRTRALLKLKRLFAPAVVETRDLGTPLGEAVFIRWLQPMGQAMIVADDPGFQQESVIVHVDGLVRHRQAVVSVALVALEAPDHCLGRLYQRSPGIDVLDALNQAASWFLSLPVRAVVELSHDRGESLVLPAGDGLFLSNVIWGKVRKTEGWRLMARPRTFIRLSQAGHDQRPLPPASDVASSVLAAGFALSGKMRQLPSPLTAAELQRLELDLADSNRGHRPHEGE